MKLEMSWNQGPPTGKVKIEMDLKINFSSMNVEFYEFIGSVEIRDI